MTSHIVAPTFSRPPETFEELANSNYGQFAVLWKNQLDRRFKELCCEYVPKLLRNVKEYPLFSKECFMAVYLGDNACIAQSGNILNRGSSFLVDINDRPLYTWAKETLFHQILTFGMSNYYKSICETLNFLVNGLFSTGMRQYWQHLRQQQSIATGRISARANMRGIPILSGKDEEEGSNKEGSLVPILWRILLLGLAPSICLLSCVLLVHFVRTNYTIQIPLPSRSRSST